MLYCDTNFMPFYGDYVLHFYSCPKKKKEKKKEVDTKINKNRNDEFE